MPSSSFDNCHKNVKILISSKKQKIYSDSTHYILLKGDHYLKKKTLLSFAFLLVMAMVLGACGKSSSGDGSTILVGVDPTFPPFETTTNGKVTGFDVDMIKAIAKAEGLKVQLKQEPFSGLIPSLKTDAIDAAVAGITIKKSRMENTNFSNAYYKSGLSILVKSDSNITGIDDLKGHLVATKKGTSSVDYLTSHGFKNKDIKEYKNIDAAYSALENGGADAVVFDNPVNLNFKQDHSDVKVVGDLLTGEYYGVAVTKKKPDLLKKINDGLAKIKKDGTYQKLFDKYFGGDTNGMVKGTKKPSDVALQE